ncbi:DUF927 domain-containing protein [Roseivivax sediminis]|uniref:Putative DNA primase/helicase n=1 Tax=Roseivivax sediminis TaxID=936889 RepID=A0A1I2CNR3_9RHOB|nr:DUF927 domain-containing protein [Roseivivax sediminis]SFE69423.1 putative DNA primase/helicase [Roseivivax sediminis]
MNSPAWEPVAASRNVVPFVNPAAEADPVPTDRSDGLPKGYHLRDDGIWMDQVDDDGHFETIRLCAPFRVSATCCRSDGGGWARVVEFEDSAGHEHKVFIEEASFAVAPQKILATLVDQGLVTEPDEQADKALKALLRAWRPDRRLLLVDAHGWVDERYETFVLPDGRVLGNTPVVTRLAQASGSGPEKGSPETWKAEVASRCLGNPVPVLAVCQALTGPLLQPLGLGGGGFHLWGASTCGKSTLMDVALSVWGSPTGFLSWRATDNGLEASAASRSGMLLALDEIGEALSPRVAGEAVYVLANGRPKQRMGRDGTARNAARWHVALLSNGEISFQEYMAIGRRTTYAGQEVRLLDLNVEGRAYGAFDTLHGEAGAREFAEALSRFAAEAYGHAGAAFVASLIPTLKKREVLRRYMQSFCTAAIKRFGLSSDGQTMRMLTRFGVCALAGELASRAGVTGWPSGTAYNAMLELVGLWVRGADRATKSEVDTVLDRTRAYLRASATSRLLPVGVSGQPLLDGWRDAEIYYLLPETWRQIHAGGNPVEAARLLRAAGLLQCNDTRTCQYRMGRNVPGRPRTYAVRSRILDEDAGS